MNCQIAFIQQFLEVTAFFVARSGPPLREEAMFDSLKKDGERQGGIKP